jgi:hypothetical protein
MKTLAITINPDNPQLETEKAYGFNFGFYTKGQPVIDWFPKSQCTFTNNILRIPEWLAKKNKMQSWPKLAPGLVWWES